MKHELIFLMFATLFCNKVLAQNNADNFLNFIKQNRSRIAVSLVENDSVLVKLNENKKMPLASTVNILTALEFSKQVAKNVILIDAKVALAEIERYYLPSIDGVAYNKWLAYETTSGHIIKDSIQLLDVARGMMMYSCNANTEFLMQTLGLDNINNNIEMLGLKKHSVIYPVVASYFMYQNPKKTSDKKILKGIKNLSEEQYCRYIYDMHKALTYDTLLKSRYKQEDFTVTLQKEWSNKLTSSTTKDYARLCNIINNRTYFDADTYTVLAAVMETFMENVSNKKWLKHAGGKGGNTAWIITKAFYGSTKNNKRIEMAYFFNDLTMQENEMLQLLMNDFELSILSKDEFRKKVAASLN
jgi:D-alanyl-D-alanine carboxypeptidase